MPSRSEPVAPLDRYRVRIQRCVDGHLIEREDFVRARDLERYVLSEITAPGDLLVLAFIHPTARLQT